MAPEVWWHLARATGLVAWALAVGSLLVGLALATRAMGPAPKGPWLLDLHRWLGGLAVVFTIGHVASLMADSFVQLDLVDVLVPMASPWRPGAVAWGVVALWTMAAIEVTSLLMRRIPKRAWRAVHLSSYALAVTATLHGVTAGTDVGHPAVAWAVLGSIGAATFFVVYRRLAPAKPARRIPARPAPSAPPLEDAEPAQAALVE
jgi:DMSO/TMAO reductase YedYZ heme-binding membrane subunit